MGLATIELAPPASRNATPGRGTRGASMARHRLKRSHEADMARLLLAADVPRPIPGDRVRASAHLLFPTSRRRDEDNYRDSLSKSLGDALAPHDPDHPFRWLSDDTPAHFAFDRVTFGLTERTARQGGRPLARITLVWGEDLVELVRADLADLEAELRQQQTRDTLEARCPAPPP